MAAAKKARIIGKIRQLEENEDFYDNSFIESSMENDQISAAEQGFMFGYLNA
ncbi:hypothetical protein KY339_03760 [Candidatus Woesearchaeota archaeon]|nr:hypothetical protein [Candidatus Woesearchaeota archaeon]